MTKTIFVDDCLVQRNISEPVRRIINEIVLAKENGDRVLHTDKHNHWNDQPRHEYHRNQGPG